MISSATKHATARYTHYTFFSPCAVSTMPAKKDTQGKKRCNEGSDALDTLNMVVGYCSSCEAWLWISRDQMRSVRRNISGISTRAMQSLVLWRDHHATILMIGRVVSDLWRMCPSVSASFAVERSSMRKHGLSIHATTNSNSFESTAARQSDWLSELTMSQQTFRKLQVAGHFKSSAPSWD